MIQLSLTIDNLPLTVPAGTTVWEAARQSGIDIPVLCHQPKLNPVGVCRVCCVEVEGARVPAASCCRAVEEGMVVRTDTERIARSRRMLVELLLAEHPTPCEKHRRWGNCELELLAEKYELAGSRFTNGRVDERKNGSNGNTLTPPLIHSSIRPLDTSSPVILVDHAACILCDRCIRACDDIQSNEVIGRMGKGHLARIAFDDDKPMGQSSCVACGECAAACPTGALVDKLLVPLSTFSMPEEQIWKSTKPVDSVCPYCGVGCEVTYHVADEKIVQVTGRDGPANSSRLCVKGRYGFDYAHHPQRLTAPLIRREAFYPKQPLSADFKSYREFRESLRSPAWNALIRKVYREATWDEALDRCASAFRRIRDERGSGALAGFGSAKVPNEDAYIFQKLIRAAFGTNNVDHCTRLCHASSVAALMENLGSGSVSDVFNNVLHSDVAVVIGSNANENHPVAASFFKQAAKQGTRLIVIDPRRPPLADHAHHYIRFKPGTDVALLNAMMHVIIRDRLVNEEFIRTRTVGFEKLKRTVKKYTAQMAERITGVPAKTIEEVARIYGRAQAAIIFWGMGISQHTTGTDNSRCLISLCLLTGNIGRPGTGLHPLRGQNNVQGASDMGLIPMVYPAYQSVEDVSVRRRYEEAWGVPLDPKKGLTVVEIMHAALHGDLKGMLMMGENPFLSDPNTSKVRRALQSLEFLAVQDIFLTETAEFADVVLPAAAAAEREGTYTNTNRNVQLGRAAVLPPGAARLDWEILCDLSTRMGYPMRYESTEAIFDEIRALTPPYAGITYDRLRRESSVTWPCPISGHPGQEVLFVDDFPTHGLGLKGRGKFTTADWMPAKELPNEDYPFVLNTGRVLQHWHTGSMTRRSKALDEIAPEPFVELHPADLAELGANDGEMLCVSSRRGAITLKARATDKVSRHNVFIPMHFKEAAVNLLTTDALDPIGKIPEFKFCAVKVERA